MCVFALAQGAAIRNRIRFAVEAVPATVEAVGGRQTSIRLSPGAGIRGATETDVPEMYIGLAPPGPAYVHLGLTTDDDVLIGLRRALPGTLTQAKVAGLGSAG
ncbi:hypothetical protein [Actinoplanes regularis]|uniref:hypothetical protein n=1 Tax=Actinoplanes regularis TaxID=52697 RepID=UPI0025567D03|nr:hypothetical protein [Actinoplanes regularis]